MSNAPFALLDALANVPNSVEDVYSFVEGLPRGGTLPVPQIGWTLIGMLHLRARRLWAWRTIEERVVPCLPEGRDHFHGDHMIDLVGKGVVPGLPDWRYELDGNASHLAHRGTGETIDVDLMLGPEHGYVMSLVHHFLSHRDPGPAERRLAQLFPHGAGCLYAVEAVRRLGLVHLSDGEEFELCGRLAAYTEDAERFIARWAAATNPSERAWLAAWVGDWPAAHDAAITAADSRLAKLTARPAAACHRQWLRFVRGWIDEHGLCHDLLLALGEAGAEDLSRYLDDALAMSEFLVSAALDLIADDPAWFPKVFHALVTTVHADGHVKNKAVRYLARHGHRTVEVIDLLLRRPQQNWESLVVLALARGDGRMEGFVRQAIRSDDPDARLTAAAVQAFQNGERGRRELLAFVKASSHRDATLEARVALRLCGDEEVLEAVEHWEAAHPERRPPDDIKSAEFHHWMMGGCKERLLDRAEELAELKRKAAEA